MLIYLALIGVCFFAHLGFASSYFAKRTGALWPWETWSLISLLVFSAGASWLSLVQPVTVAFGILYLLLVFFVSLYVGKPWKRNAFTGKSSSILWLLCVSALLFALGGAARITYNDTLIYHTQAIRWIQEYAVVPGLGNLHTRFAFNSHLFTAAAGSSFVYKEALLYPFNTLLLIVLIATLLRKIKTNLASGGGIPVLVYVLLLFIVILLYPSWAHAPSPDIAIAALTLFMFVYAWDAMAAPRMADIILLSALVATAIAYKLSTIFLGLLPLYLIWRFSALRGATHSFRAVGWSLLVGALVLLPFFLRNVGLSGYLVYPFPGIDLFNVDWKIPAATAQFDSDYITAWARVPRAPVYEVLAMPFAEWFPQWARKKSLPFTVLLLGTAFSALVFIWSVCKRRWHTAFTLFVVWVNVLFWWATAPDPRFIHGILFIATALSLGIVLQSIKAITLPWRAYQFLTVAAIFMAVFTIKDDVRALATKHIVIPRPYPTGQQQWVRTEAAAYRIPAVDNQCFNAPLPCAEKPIDHLEMRGQTLAEGYRIKSNESP